MNELSVLERRLSKIGIGIELSGNIPWIYLTKVNGNVIKPSDYTSNHGFTIAWYKDDIVLDSDTKRIFQMIRKYK
jgi:hypothetical protein